MIILLNSTTLADLRLLTIFEQSDARTTITMSLAQTSFCKKHQYDPEDPLCAHVILTGTLVRVLINAKNNSEVLGINRFN